MAPTKLNTLQFQVPHVRNPHFTGRSQLLQDLHDALIGTGKAALNQSAVIAGLGGIGKTRTAVEYAYRHYPQDYAWVFWVRAETELELVTDLAKLGRSLGLGTEQDKDDELITRSLRWLETHDRWLLIFDNADDPKIVKPWLPRNAPGRILLTSRAQRFTSLGIRAPIAVKKLSLEESIAFLRDRTHQPDLDGTELAAATALSTELDGLPLALEQAAAYLDRVGVSFAVYWKYYQQQRLALLEEEPPDTWDYPASVANTWLLNFAAVERRSPASVPILHLSAVLAADDIPESLLLACAEEFGLVDCTDERALGKQLAHLADFSLIQRERQTASYSIHRLVQAVIWQQLSPTEQQDWMLRAIAGLSAVFPDVAKIDNWVECRQLAPHVQAIAVLPEAVRLETIEWAGLLSVTGNYLFTRGRYGKAESLYQRALEIGEQQLGKDHPDMAITLNNLANLYRAQGRYAEAKSLTLEALKILEQQSGADHPDMASSLKNLAGIYRVQGHYTEAKSLYQRLLEITEQQSGVDHPDMAIMLNSLANLYFAQGLYTEGELLYRKVLEIYEQHLESDHPEVATSLSNLAEICHAQRRYEEAEPLYVRSLSIFEQHFDADHPQVATILNNLAHLYHAQKRYTEAERLYRKSLEIVEQQFGKDHPQVATILNNLANLYHAQERYTEAEPLYVRSLEILTTKLGLNHPDTRQRRENLAILYGNMATQFKLQGCYDKVVESLEKTITLRSQLLQ